MVARRAFTLVELLVVILIVALAATLAGGAFHSVKARTRLATCAAGLRALHVGLTNYAVQYANCFPPFAFSDKVQANLPLSGGWGGACKSTDKPAQLRVGMTNLGLWAVTEAKMATPSALVCPGADQADDMDPPEGTARAGRFSTYCLRMPYSEGLFRHCPELLARSKQIDSTCLGVYRWWSGGQAAAVGTRRYTVPLVRLDWRYGSAGASGGQPHTADMSAGAWLADGFWLRNHRPSDPSASTWAGHPGRAEWWHRASFNVACASGSVKTVTDDGTVARNTRDGSTAGPASDGVNFATFAEEVWRYFDLCVAGGR